MTPGGTARLRLFFALWPGDALRAALATATRAAVAGIDGQAVPPGNLHVTLAFLGMTAGNQLAPLIQVGGAEAWPAVPLAFGRLEYWAKPRVLVAACAGVPDAGTALVAGLWQRLEKLGFERELRPWRPHLTLVRRIRRPPEKNLPPLAPIELPGSDWRLALVESASHPAGPRYKALADWPLCG